MVKLTLRVVLAIFFIGAAINHFAHPRFYDRMVPPFLPWPRAIVIISGVCELVLGALLLVPATSRFAAWGLVALLIGVFPANIYMAMRPELFGKFTPAMLWVRLPLQFVLIAWAWWYTR